MADTDMMDDDDAFPMDGEDDFGDFDEGDGFGEADDFGGDGDFGQEIGLGDSYESGPSFRPDSYVVLSEDHLLKESEKMIKDIMEFCNLTSTEAAVLLRYSKWNREDLISQYLEDSARLLKAAGIKTVAKKKVSKTDSSSRHVTCLVCLEKVRRSKAFSLGCRHKYCRDCWAGYLENQIAEGPECVKAICIRPGCTEVVHEKAYKKLVSPELYSKYEHYLLRSFVEDNPLVKWCPAPGCIYAIRSDLRDRREAVVCKCGFRFCFQCSDSDIGDHMPATCLNVEQWMEKASDESENVNWLMANTKRCPECRSPIEKNGGCMHMTCSKASGGCGHEFCWLCREPWSTHGSHTGGYYACNKYDSSTAKKEDDSATSAKTDLEYYMWHYHRYDSHKSAGKIADKQRAEAEKKGSKLQRALDVRFADTKFLGDAAEQLLACRRVLRWSYVYGFYLDKSLKAERNLFLYLQEELEKNTNRLSELYEKPLRELSSYQIFQDWKMQVTSFTGVTSKFLDNFVNGVADGLTSRAL
mmetsp:Transcript_42957/g.108434  ORF Transcript_42957/g.108434 Transcript_42957/m.108434 type:complete len:526 (-) Transcript_42957:588-2165(-)|eukprot:CAMPEP_0177681678 /NCGR_PEP_ID=MMETSP0447-20121125/30853_1 /TAXON_ID=0 /ORGANISM="Stygamoeba regulata, Strain BSH-02190019" /LENGTH=525 /DNA_ID=CAMNT_0019191129 /DNA_START=148 /DNA_END=1725 /DNA_ORIENTATION=-